MRSNAYPALFRSNKEDSVITLDDWIRFFVAGLGLTASIYVIMQVVALAIARGKSRYVVLVPLVLFLFSLYATADAYRIDSNLWPLPMLAASVIGIVYLTVAATLHFVRHRASTEDTKR